MTGFRRDSVAREWLIMIVAAAVLLALPWIMVQVGGYRELATRIIIFAIFALGFDLLVGFTGYLSFGHAAFWGIGAYVCGYTLLHYSPNPLLGMLVAVVVVAVVALLLGLITLRRHGIYFAILTLAFAEMFYFAALAPLQRWTGGDNGLTAIPTPNLFGIELQGGAVHLFTCFWALLAIYFALRIRRSPYGLILKAIKANEKRLLYTGVDVYRYKVAAFAISGIYGGLAGSLYAIYETYVPTESLRWTTSGEVIIMSVIGGLGTLFGPMIGAGIVLYLENVLSAITSEWNLILGLIFMAFVIFLPGGVVEGFARLGRRLAGGRAARAEPGSGRGRDKAERSVDR